MTSILCKLTRGRPWLMIVAAWLAVYATRPGRLGFYSDDWSILLLSACDHPAFSAGRFARQMELYANRPVHGLITFVLSSVCGDSPGLWHIAAAGLALASAVVLYDFLQVALRLCGWDCRPAAAGAAALWTLFPWMLGVTAWPSMVPTLVALILFVLAGRLLLDGWQRGEAPYIAPAILLLASMLTYEAFYGQFALLLLIGGLGGVARKVGIRRVMPFVVASVTVQALAVAWNRLAPLLFHVAATKSFSPQWGEKLRHSVAMLPYAFRYSAPELSPLPELLVVTLALACAVAVVSARVMVAKHGKALQHIALMAVAAFGMFASLLVPALAGYSYSWIGQESRILLGFSLWLCVAIALALAPALHASMPIRAVAVTSSVTLGVLMALATQARLREWAEVWDIQRRTIATAPAAQLRAAAADSVVLVTGPHRHKGLTVFAYPWDLDGLMKFNFPSLAGLRFLPARDDYVTTWDGHRVTQRKGGTLIHSLEANEVWVWARDQAVVRRVSPPFECAARVGGSI